MPVLYIYFFLLIQKFLNYLVLNCWSIRHTFSKPKISHFSTIRHFCLSVFFFFLILSASKITIKLFEMICNQFRSPPDISVLLSLERWPCKGRARACRVCIRERQNVCVRIYNACYKCAFMWRRNFLVLMQPERRRVRKKEKREKRGNSGENKKERMKSARKRETENIKCRAHMPCRNCSLRFSREDLRRDLRLHTKLPLREIISDAR